MTRAVRSTPVLLALLLALPFWSCGSDSTAPSDTAAPVVTITSPTTGGTWQTGETTLTVSGTASDDTGVVGVTWSVQGGQSGTASGTTSWTATVTLSEGSNTVTIRASDATGNAGTATLIVDVDASVPTVTIQTPTAEAQYYSSETPVEVAGTASDDSEIDRVEWELVGGGSGTADGTTSWTIASLALEEGENVLTVTAVDDFGNTGSATLTIFLDQTAPTVTIIGPTAEDEYNTTASEVDLEGMAADAGGLDRVEWSVEGGASGTADGTEEWSAADVAVALGENEVTVTAFDRAGNAGTATLTVRRHDALASMSLAPSVILTNRAAPIRVTVAVDPALSVGGDGVRLAVVDAANAVVEELATLLDNGNLNNGDEILGDGVFGAQVVVSEGDAQDLRLQIVADVTAGASGEARSPVTVLTIHEPTTSQEDQIQEDVQEDAAATLDQMLAAGTTVTEAVTELVTHIESQAGVVDARADGTTAITIEYESGLQGGLILTKVDESGNQITRGGLLPGTSRTSSARSTASMAWERARGLVGLVPDTVKRAGEAKVPLRMQTVGRRSGASARFVRSSGPVGMEPDDVILNRRVLIFAPYEAVWAPFNEGPDLVQLLEDSPLEFEVDYTSNQAATVAVLQNLTQYGLVVLATHGASGRHFLTGEIATTEAKETYDALRKAGQVLVWKKVEINEDENGASVESDVFGVNDSFVSALPGTFPHSLVVNNSCESTLADHLQGAFLDKGAEAYAGYSKVVNSDFAVDMVLGLVGPMVGDDLETVGEAFTPAQTDPSSPNAVFELEGNEELHYSDELINGDFELGDLSGWTALGDGRVISSLGTETPAQGSFMGIISTGLGFTTSSGSISQSFRVPADATELVLRFNFLSEEFLEFIGSQYQDQFDIVVVRESGSEDVLYSRTIDQIAAEFGGCPGAGCQLIDVSPGIVFDVGDVHMTGWQMLTLDFSAYQDAFVTLRFQASDVGDSIFDTAILLDAVAIN